MILNLNFNVVLIRQGSKSSKSFTASFETSETATQTVFTL